MACDEHYFGQTPGTGDRTRRPSRVCRSSERAVYGSWLKVTKFPGAVGVEIANQITKAVQELAECNRLILDLRGNESGGLAFVRLASYLTPQRRTIGYSVTRAGAARGSVDSLKRFGWIPGHKAGLLWLAAKYGFSDPSVRVETEGLG